MNPLLEDLQWRGLLYQSTDLDALSKRLDEGPICLYCGFDPTADSLHVGHLVPVLLLRRFVEAGHKPIALVGGITAMIGDPKPDSERQLLSDDTVDRYAQSLHGQLKELVGESIELVNNADWLRGVHLWEFLRDVGKFFNVRTMLSKDSVTARMDRDQGISFTEFTYQTLQGYDFYHLYKTKDCQLQACGSDQWGNVTAGLDLIRRKDGGEGYALSCPLITKSDGTKFGKSEGGAVWLDANKTSAYQFYQFWLNVEDAKVLDYLKVYSFKSRADIEAIAADFEANPGARAAQRALAEELTVLVHGQEALDQSVMASEALFGRGELNGLTAKTLRGICETIPHSNIEGEIPDLASALVDLGLVKSKNQAREAINSGGVYVNNTKVEDPSTALSPEAFIYGCALIRRGKKNLGALVRPL